MFGATAQLLQVVGVIFKVTTSDGPPEYFSDHKRAVRYAGRKYLQPDVEETPFTDVLLDDGDISINTDVLRVEAPDAQYREELMTEYAHAIPSYHSIDYLRQFDEIVEIGAGNGYWAFLLEQLGVDVTAFDKSIQLFNATINTYDGFGTEPPNVRESFNEAFAEVHIGRAEKAGYFPDRPLFLCWPPNHDRMAFDAVDYYNMEGGEVVLYLGEGPGGTHADMDFHRFLDEHYQLTRCIHNISWMGYSDSLHVYTKSGEPVVDFTQEGYKVMETEIVHSHLPDEDEDDETMSST